MTNPLIRLLTQDLNSIPNDKTNLISDYPKETIEATIQHFTDEFFKLSAFNDETLQQLEADVEYEVVSRKPNSNTYCSYGNSFSQNFNKNVEKPNKVIYLLSEFLFERFDKYFINLGKTDLQVFLYMEKAFIHLQQYYPAIKSNKTRELDIYFEAISKINTLKPRDFIKTILTTLQKYFSAEEISICCEKVLLNLSEETFSNTTPNVVLRQNFMIPNEGVHIGLYSGIYEYKFLEKYPEYKESDELAGEYTNFFVLSGYKYSEVVSRIESVFGRRFID